MAARGRVRAREMSDAQLGGATEASLIDPVGAFQSPPAPPRFPLLPPRSILRRLSVHPLHINQSESSVHLFICGREAREAVSAIIIASFILYNRVVFE